MIDIIDRLHAAIWEDLLRAHDELADARGRQRQKDSPGNRAAVATCLSRMDAALDRYLLAQTIRR